MHNIGKWSNILQKYCGVHNASFFKYVWPFFDIIHERVKIIQATAHSISNVETCDRPNLKKLER